MTEIHVGSGRAYAAPLNGGPWRELGYTDNMSITVEDEFTREDFEALKRGFAGGQTVTTTFILTRRQMRSLWAVLVPSVRNRRRNPMHAVRDRLRRHHRGRGHGR